MIDSSVYGFFVPGNKMFLLQKKKPGDEKSRVLQRCQDEQKDRRPVIFAWGRMPLSLLQGLKVCMRFEGWCYRNLKFAARKNIFALFLAMGASPHISRCQTHGRSTVAVKDPSTWHTIAEAVKKRSNQNNKWRCIPGLPRNLVYAIRGLLLLKSKICIKNKNYLRTVLSDGSFHHTSRDARRMAAIRLQLRIPPQPGTLLPMLLLTQTKTINGGASQDCLGIEARVQDMLITPWMRAQGNHPAVSSGKED